MSWAANNTLDENRRAVLVALIVGFGNAAGLVSSNVFRAQDEPKVRTSFELPLSN